jgi:hypothetical protein
VPWSIVGRIVDAKYKASAHPIGRVSTKSHAT